MKKIFFFGAFASVIVLGCKTSPSSPKNAPASASNSQLVTISCVDQKQNLCNSYTLLPELVASKLAECRTNGMSSGNGSCQMEGSYTACTQNIGSAKGQNFTWTVYDPASKITAASCQQDGGVFSSSNLTGSSISSPTNAPASASNSQLVTISCVDQKQNLCNSYTLLPELVASKLAECSTNGMSGGNGSCQMEGPYTACTQNIGSANGQNFTWTIYDPASKITAASCQQDGGTFSSSKATGSTN